MSCMFGIFKNEVATAMLSRKDDTEKEERVTPHIFLFAVKLLVSQNRRHGKLKVVANQQQHREWKYLLSVLHNAWLSSSLKICQRRRKRKITLPFQVCFCSTGRNLFTYNMCELQTIQKVSQLAWSNAISDLIQVNKNELITEQKRCLLRYK